MKEYILHTLSENFNVPKIINLEMLKDYESSSLFAVRSNDSSEDTNTNSNAGKFPTELFVPKDNVEAAVKRILKEADNAFIQEMIVDPLCSAVVLIRGSDILINITNGLCEGITSGKISGSTFKFDNFVYKSKFGKQKEELIFNGTEIVKKKSLKENYNLEIIRDIIDTVNKVQNKLMIKDLNIELTVTKNKEIYILQARNLI